MAVLEDELCSLSPLQTLHFSDLFTKSPGISQHEAGNLSQPWFYEAKIGLEMALRFTGKAKLGEQPLRELIA